MDFPVLAALDQDVRRRLLLAAQRRRFKRNEVIFHAGDPANSMHLIVSGHVSVRVTTPMGDTAILGVLGPGATVGELALLSATAERSATATALDPTETLTLTNDDFARIRREHPAVDRFLLDLLAGYVHRLDARLLEALYVPVEKRVLRRLLALGETYGDRSAGTVIPLTQEILAELAGTTRPTANQVLRAAEAAGLVTIGRGRIRIEDAAGLARRAG